MSSYSLKKENNSKLTKNMVENKRKIMDLEQRNEELENEKRNYQFDKDELLEKLNYAEEKQIIEQ